MSYRHLTSTLGRGDTAGQSVHVHLLLVLCAVRESSVAAPPFTANGLKGLPSSERSTAPQPPHQPVRDLPTILLVASRWKLAYWTAFLTPPLCLTPLLQRQLVPRSRKRSEIPVLAT